MGSRSGPRLVVNCCFRKHTCPEDGPLDPLGIFHRKENWWWLKSPENLPTRKRARREKNTAMSVKMAWTCLSILGAAGIKSSPTGEKQRSVEVRAGRAKTVTSFSQGSYRLEKETFSVDKATDKDQGLIPHRGCSGVLDTTPTLEGLATEV